MKKKKKQQQQRLPICSNENFSLSLSAAKAEKGDFQLSNSELLEVHIVPSTSSEIETHTQKPPTKP
jgi:hypothetical protein